MDDADRVTEKAELQMKVDVYQHKRDEPVAVANGVCLFCEASIKEEGRRWCDADCRDSWEREELL